MDPNRIRKAQVLNFVQNVVDKILIALVGFSTRRGWEKQRKQALTNYKKSAQKVT